MLFQELQGECSIAVTSKRKIIQESACETTADPVVAGHMGDARQAIHIMRVEFQQTARRLLRGLTQL